MRNINHVVWPTGIPYCHGNWGQETWDSHADQFRPDDYKGGRFDTIAWNAYAAQKDEIHRQKMYASFGSASSCEPLQRNVDAIKIFTDRELLGISQVV